MPNRVSFGKPNRIGPLSGGGRLNAREPVQRSLLCSAGAVRRRNWGVQAREMASQNETQTLKAGSESVFTLETRSTGNRTTTKDDV